MARLDLIVCVVGHEVVVERGVPEVDGWALGAGVAGFEGADGVLEGDGVEGAQAGEVGASGLSEEGVVGKL